MKYLALAMIIGGLGDIFLRNFYRKLVARPGVVALPGREPWRSRLKKLKKAAPSYIIIMLGVFLLLAYH